MKQLGAASRFDASGRLQELAGLPTLVLSARHDRIAPPQYGRALAERIPGARYVEVADGGHAVTIQCAREVNGVLTEHPGAGPSRRTGVNRIRRFPLPASLKTRPPQLISPDAFSVGPGSSDPRRPIEKPS